MAFAGASMVGALVDSSGALIAARVAMGMSAAVIFPTTLSIISNTFRERRERAAALGVWGAVVGIGVAAGPVVGGLLLEHFAWGSVFWALVPLALVTAAAAYVLVPESRDPAVPPLDLPGLVLSIAMLSALVYTIIEAPAHGWASAHTIGGFALSALLLLAFVSVERRTTHPMLDLSLFRDRRFSAASGAVTVTFFALFGFIFLITQYFQFVRGYGTLSTGARILPVALSIAVASVVGALLAPRIGTKLVVTSGLVLFGTSFVWISTVAVDASYATTIVPQMVMMGLGMGFISTPATESILQVLPPSRAGVGSAVNDATRELGGTLGVAVVGSVFSSVYAAHLADGAWSRLPGGALGEAQDSVGAATSIAVGSAAARPGAAGRVHERPAHLEPDGRPALPGRCGRGRVRAARPGRRAAGRVAGHPRTGRRLAVRATAVPRCDAARVLTESFAVGDREVRWGRRGDGPPVVFCHGTPWSSALWAPIADALTAEHTVYLWDMLGYGASSMADGDVSLGAQGRVLADLLDHWALAAPDVVAHDYGGAVALRAHLLHGAAYRSLALVDVVALAPWGSDFFRLVAEHASVFAALPAPLHEALVRAYVAGAAHRPLRAEDLDLLVGPWLGNAGQAAFYRQIAQADQRYTDEIEPLYPTLDLPVQVVWGTEDTWIPVDRAHRLAELVPGARLDLVEDAGHLVQLDAPDRLTEILRRWLAR